MTRQLAIAVGLVALALPAVAQEHTYDYEDETGSAWSSEPAPPGDGSYSEYSAEDARPNVDVSVDMATPEASVTFDTFRDRLSPYGEWVNVPNYGQVWRPAHVAADWRPYYYGRWEWTDEGWLWVSDEPWGWAAYHYGRWAYDPYYSWFWVPGYQWAPAWVTWRYSPDYIGWAPLAPGFSVYVSTYPVAFTWWTFVPCQSFVAVPVFRAAVPFSHVRGIFHGTAPAPPRARVFGAVAPAWGGPARPFLEHRLGRPVQPVRLQVVHSPAAAAAPARAGVVPIYRPEVRAPAAGRPAIAAPPPSRPPMAPPGRAATAAPMRPWGGNVGTSGRPMAPLQGGARPAQPRGWQGGAPPPAGGSQRMMSPVPGGSQRMVAPPAGAPRMTAPRSGSQRMMSPVPAGPRFAPGARSPSFAQPQARAGMQAPRAAGGGGGGHAGHPAQAGGHRR